MAKAAKASVKAATSGVFEASLGVNGAVVRGNKLKVTEAIEHRTKGYNVVVCGSNSGARAQAIEKSAYGNVVNHGPNPNAGAHALWHYQPDPRGTTQGHTFYESPGRSAQ